MNNTSGSGLGTGAVTVASGATLGGTGAFSGAVAVTGKLAPGPVTAILRTGSLSFGSGGVLALDLSGTTPGTGHDQVAVTGTVDLTGSALTVLTPTAFNVGDSFIIIANDGTADAVGGTFGSGATLTTSEYVFSINYAGGDGNDVVLTVATIINAPPVNTVPAGPLTVAEDGTLPVTGVSVGDPDAGAAPIVVTLSVLQGTLTTTATPGVAAMGSGSNQLTLTGSISALNVALATLVYKPNADYNGPDTLTVLTNDQGNTGSDGPKTDTDTVAIIVTSVNDAPAGTDATVTTNEDTDYTFTTADFGFTDPNDTPVNDFLAVKITTLPGAGTLTNNGVAVSAGDFISVADIAAGKLKFSPALDGNGAPYATFTFQVQDDGGTAFSGVDLDQTPNTITINVTSVNDAPAGTDATVTTNEDTDYTFATADFGFTDPNDSPANALLAVKITTLPALGTLTLNGLAVGAGQFVSAADIAAGKLKFTPAANANGASYASFTFQVQDDGGTTGPGAADLDPTPNTITVNVTSVNDAPAGTDKMVTTNEDTAYVFTTADFGFTDPNDAPADTFTGVVVTTLPTTGTLTNNGTAVTAGQFVSAADIAAGRLRFTPAANANGTVTFTFQVQDNGAVGPNLDPTPNTLSVAVTPINDEPALALATGAITVDQNSNPFVQNNFATFAPGGGPDEATQTPSFLVTSSNPALFSTAPAIDASGKLTFTPAPGAVGTATITVIAVDSGSNVAPNDNTSAAAQFTITVNTPVAELIARGRTWAGRVWSAFRTRRPAPWCVSSSRSARSSAGSTWPSGT